MIYNLLTIYSFIRKDVFLRIHNGTKIKILIFIYLSLPAIMFENSHAQSYPLSVNGKYPLGLYSVPPSSFAEIAAAGFNIIHQYSSRQNIDDAIKYLSESKVYNLKVLQNMPSAYINESDTFWLNWINSLKNYESLEWWYLPEEESATNIAPISYLIKANDEIEHLRTTYLPWNSETTMSRYINVLDILMIGSYPEHYHEPRANVMSWLINGLNLTPKIPYIVSVIPSFNEGAGWPSPQDVRCDAYTSIISGAHGIFWFSYYYVRDNHQVWQEMKNIANEINGSGNLAPIIMSPHFDESITSTIISGPKLTPYTYIWEDGGDVNKSFNSIQWIAKIFNGITYIFAVNLAQVYPPRTDYTDATVVNRFGNLNIAQGKAEVLFEDRIISINDKSFEDTFNELEVHIYKIAPKLPSTPTSPRVED